MCGLRAAQCNTGLAGGTQPDSSKTTDRSTATEAQAVAGLEYRCHLVGVSQCILSGGDFC